MIEGKFQNNIWLFGCSLDYIYRILHGGAKILILSSSGENNILRMSATNESNIVFTTRR